jgi:hypothetical protein
MECYRCGKEGHLKSGCPARLRLVPAIWPAAMAAPALPTPLPRRPPAPPAPSYLEVRTDLGMPSQAAHLHVSCSWCGSADGQQCVNIGTGRGTATHQARLDELARVLAGRGVPRQRFGPCSRFPVTI